MGVTVLGVWLLFLCSYISFVFHLTLQDSFLWYFITFQLTFYRIEECWRRKVHRWCPVHVIFLLNGDDFLYWDPLTQGALFHSHSSLHRKFISFFLYSEWVNRQYVETLKKLTATGKQFGAILAAHSIATTLKYWYHGSPPGEIVSLGVLSEGKSGLVGLFLSGITYRPPCIPVLLLLCPHLLPYLVCKLLDFHSFIFMYVFIHSLTHPFRNSVMFCVSAQGTGTALLPSGDLEQREEEPATKTQVPLSCSHRIPAEEGKARSILGRWQEESGRTSIKWWPSRKEAFRSE